MKLAVASLSSKGPSSNKNYQTVVSSVDDAGAYVGVCVTQIELLAIVYP